MPELNLKPINRKRCKFAIVGTSPLIQHAWSEKARQQIIDKQGGKKTRDRSKRNPEAEAAAATYITDKQGVGVPILAIKAALISAAHKDLGIEKTLVRKALFFPCEDSNKLIAIEHSEPFIRQDMVRVGAGTADLRYRPQFDEWRVPDLIAEYDADLLRMDDIANLVDRAGFGVGIGEWRPEKGGENGRFEIDRTVPMAEVE